VKYIVVKAGNYLDIGWETLASGRGEVICNFAEYKTNKMPDSGAASCNQSRYKHRHLMGKELQDQTTLAFKYFSEIH
jgi:hypothetical protein